MIKCETGTVIPTNNTPLPCEEYKSTDCIIHQNAIIYLGLPAQSSLTTVLAAVLASLADARNRIQILENQINQ